jgi:glutaredoxin 3
VSFPRPDEIDSHVVVYTTPFCGFCRAAVRLLKLRAIPFVERDVSGDRDARKWLAEASGQHTVPQIFFGGRSIGGYDELAAIDASGNLAREVSRGRPT